MPNPPDIKSVWFLPQTRDRPVKEAITLGNIILSPHHPEEAVNSTPVPTIPPTALRRHEEAPWSWTKEFRNSRSGGLFATFMQVAGVGGEVGLSSERGRTDIYNAERLVTEEFIPDKAYIAALLEDEDVRDVLTGPGRESRVYLVTGLKVAYGAAKATESMRQNGKYAQVGVDASASGMPVSAGVKGRLSSKVTESLTAGKSDFVFGFKLRQLRYKRSRVMHTAYDKGAQFGLGVDGATDEEEDDEDEDQDVDLGALEIDEISEADLGMRKRKIAVDEGGEVECLFP